MSKSNLKTQTSFFCALCTEHLPEIFQRPTRQTAATLLRASPRGTSYETLFGYAPDFTEADLNESLAEMYNLCSAVTALPEGKEVRSGIATDWMCVTVLFESQFGSSNSKRSSSPRVPAVLTFSVRLGLLPSTCKKVELQQGIRRFPNCKDSSWAIERIPFERAKSHDSQEVILVVDNMIREGLTTNFFVVSCHHSDRMDDDV